MNQLLNRCRAFNLSFAFIGWTVLALRACAGEQLLHTEANVMVELRLTASHTHDDPFNTITLDVIFKDPKDHEMRVPGFWDGGNVWKVRYASPVVGTHGFRSECSDTADSGLHGIAGAVEIKPYSGKNPLFAHGPLHVSANKRYLQHDDGTPFLWLGDTWWMGLCHRLHFPDEFKELAADRKEKGFTLIQIVAGLYPDMPPFDPRGANEAGFPWEKDFASIRPEYFDAADKRLAYLVEQGLTPCIVGAWGYFIPLMGVEKAKQHWRYLIARYGAMPVVWCVAGEANLPYYLAKGFPYDDRQQVKDWTKVARYLRETDPFHRLTTIHPTGIGRLSARNAIDDLTLLDIDMLQTPHGQREAVPPTVRTIRESYADKPVMPVINGEASYEMLMDKIPSEWTRRMFWLCMMNGAAGHTYGANGIWQCNRRGEPHGPSPHHNGGDGYGRIPWDDAMKLPGSQQAGLGKKLLEEFAWQDFRPHPEWAEFAGKEMLSFEGCQWIWYPEDKPSQNAPAARRYFRRTFVLPEGRHTQRARLRICADDTFTARLNGEKLGSSDDWHVGKQFNDFASLLKSGVNVLAVEAENRPFNGANPAGLIACLELHFADGESFKLVSDKEWRCEEHNAAGWDAGDLNDSDWAKALVLGRYGVSPWGQIEPSKHDDAFGPQSTGIPGVVRIIYVPESEPIVVRKLGRRAVYAAVCFDPVTGTKTPLGEVRADEAGSWNCSPLTGLHHDWALILRAKASEGPSSQQGQSDALQPHP